jgi:hypothetical protein
LLSFRHALKSGEIAVRAYVTHAGEDKQVTHRLRLGGAVLEQQPAAGLKMRTRPVDDGPEAG